MVALAVHQESILVASTGDELHEWGQTNMTISGPSASGPSLPPWMGPDDPDSPHDEHTDSEKIDRIRSNLSFLLDVKIFDRIVTVIKADPLTSFIYMSCAIDCLA